jgi:hypothetical protein
MLVTLIFYVFYLEGHITRKLKSNPEIKGRNSIFFRHDALQVSGHALSTSTPRVFLLNIYIEKNWKKYSFLLKTMQSRNIVIFSKPYEILSMKYLWPSTINTQNIFSKFYYLTELLGFFYLSSISIYNEAKTMTKGISWTRFHKVLKISLCYDFAWFSVRQTLKHKYYF